MLSRKFASRALAVVALCSTTTFHLPVAAQEIVENGQSLEQRAESAGAALSITKMQVMQDAEPIKMACGLCGCSETCAVVGVESEAQSRKNSSIMTDSLWGNLILQMAYQRDEKIKKLSKRLGLVNLGTMVAVSAIAGGALAQGIDSLYMLNPSDGHLDSYTPGIIGVSLSGATLLTFGTKIALTYKYQRQLKARQKELKQQVEKLLNHLEYSDSKCDEARKELTDLIGERATREFMQIWQSSHAVAAKPSNQS